MSIVITGSTGQLGTLIIQNLVKLVPAANIIATTRSTTTDKAKTLSSLGVKVLEADFNDSPALIKAFTGAQKVLITSVDKLGDEAFKAHKTAFDAAKEAGVKKIFYTSQVASSDKSHVPFGKDHWRCEQYLEKSGMDFTSFRNGFYMSSLSMMLPKGFEYSGKITCAEDGKVSWTSHKDLAEGIAKLIASDNALPRYVTLTNTKAWDMADLAKLLTPIVGRPIEREVISEEQHKETLLGFGVPEMYVDIALNGYRGMKDGEFGSTDGYLTKLLGRDCDLINGFLEKEYGQKAEQASH